MNKYYIRIPYSFIQYGELSGCVYAEDEDEAAELARDYENIVDCDYEDGDADSTEYNYSAMEISLDEADVSLPANLNSRLHSSQSISWNQLPTYYLADIKLL